MADVVAVSEAIKERLAPVLDNWNVMFFEPTAFTVPAVCIEGDPGKSADPTETWGNFTRWQMRITLFYNAISEESSVRNLGHLTAADGPLRRTLEDEDVVDSLAALTRNTGHYVQVTNLGPWRLERKNNNRYRTAVISVVVGTN